MSESEFRCRECNKKLFTSDASDGRSTIVCPRCGKANTIYHGGYKQQGELRKAAISGTM